MYVQHISVLIITVISIICNAIYQQETYDIQIIENIFREYTIIFVESFMWIGNWLEFVFFTQKLNSLYFCLHVHDFNLGIKNPQYQWILLNCI